jgi:parallel beta-helix repeat protein
MSDNTNLIQEAAPYFAKGATGEQGDSEALQTLTTAELAALVADTTASTYDSDRNQYVQRKGDKLHYSNFHFRTVASLVTFLNSIPGLVPDGATFLTNGRNYDSDSKPRTWVVEPNSPFESANGGTVRILSSGQRLKMMNWDGDVRDFGAKGDASTDDTAAIQAAFDAQQAGAVIRFEYGQYKISAPIVVSKWMTIVGYDSGIIEDSNNLITGATLADTGMFYVTADYVKFRGLEFSGAETEGAFSGPSDTFKAAIVVNNASRVIVKDCLAKGKSYVVHFDNCSDCGVHDCQMEGFLTQTHANERYNAAVSIKGGLRIFVGNNKVSGFGSIISPQDTPDEIIVQGNQIRNCQAGGVYGKYIKDSVIANNTISNIAGDGIHAEGTGIVVKGNTVLRCVNGVKMGPFGQAQENLYGGDSNVVSGNVIRECTGDGIYAYDSNSLRLAHCVIEGNMVVDMTGYGFYGTGDFFVLKGNNFFGGLGIATYLPASFTSNKGWVIEGNVAAGGNENFEINDMSESALLGNVLNGVGVDSKMTFFRCGRNVIVGNLTRHHDSEAQIALGGLANASTNNFLFGNKGQVDGSFAQDWANNKNLIVSSEGGHFSGTLAAGSIAGNTWASYTFAVTGVKATDFIEACITDGAFSHLLLKPQAGTDEIVLHVYNTSGQASNAGGLAVQFNYRSFDGEQRETFLT